MATNHRQFLAFVDIKNERAYLVGGGSGKYKNIYPRAGTTFCKPG
jgi:hypothetical protein